MTDLDSLLQNSKRIAVLGVGNEDKGDDGAGVEFVKILRAKIKSPDLLLTEAGKTPENFTGEIKRFKPDLTLLVDAADFGGRPGEVILASPDMIKGASFSTHSLPLSVLAEYIQRETGSTVLLLGIQPKQIELGAELSAEVKSTIRRLTDRISEFYRRR